MLLCVVAAGALHADTRASRRDADVLRQKVATIQKRGELPGKAQRTKRLREAKQKRQAEDARAIVMKSMLKRVPHASAPYILRALIDTTQRLRLNAAASMRSLGGCVISSSRASRAGTRSSGTT